MENLTIGQSVKKLGNDYTTGRLGQIQGLIPSENRALVLWLKDSEGQSMNLVTKCMLDLLEPIEHEFKDEDFISKDDTRGCDKYYRIKGFARYELGSNGVVYNVKSKKEIKPFPSGAENVLFVFMINDKGNQEKVNYEQLKKSILPTKLAPKPKLKAKAKTSDKKPRKTLLTMEQVREIRRLKEEHNLSDIKLAERFGCSKQNIYHICKYHIYKEA